MICYATAKKLKEAGYPQKGSYWTCEHMPDNTNGWCKECDEDEKDIYLPSLDELVYQASNENGLQAPLQLQNPGWENNWYAYSREKKGSGPTPDEAMASLYLDIHKPPKQL